MTEVFAILPPPAKALAIMGAVVILMLGLGSLMLHFLVGARSARVELTDESLTVTGGPYGRRIAAGDLDVDGARAVNLREEPQFAPKWRTNGAGFPGFLSGWFRLHNGAKALLFVTDPTRVVLVPTTNDYLLMVSVEDPDRFLSTLAQLAAA